VQEEKSGSWFHGSSDNLKGEILGEHEALLAANRFQQSTAWFNDQSFAA
jgi:hypothetical protein